MAAGIKIKAGLKLMGFRGFAAAISDKTFQKHLKKRVGRATKQNALLTVREIRQTMKKEVSPRNAALTVAIKRSKKTLTDKGDLFGAVTHEQKSWDKAFVGVKQNDSEYQLAKGLHNGMIIPVTQKMRTMFFYLWLASQEARGEHEGKPVNLTGRAAILFERFKDWHPLRANTRVIRIPGRPFIKITMRNPALKKRLEANWREAARLAYEDARQEGLKKK